jgi:predicted Rdx family selenoprotein
MAASLAAAIERATDVRVRLQPGGPGQFDVVVDGEVVAARKTGFWNLVFGSGWPKPAAVIAAIERKRNAAPA